VLGFARVQTLGRYELLKRLGSGGMGEVWLARARGPERVQKLVVLKRLLPERLADEAARARFVDEARIAVGLSHPRLVPVFDFGSENGEYFLAMEYMRGGDLARIAGIDRAPLMRNAVALLGSELCDALAYVHAKKDRREAGLVHGDVTPHNVLLSQDGHALLADFGLTRFAPRDRAGTRRYQAPEQARGEPFDGRADLYALALVLVEAATGKPAYDRDPERAAAQAKVGLVPALESVDAELAAVLQRALSPSAESRPDARSLRDQFDALLDREPRARTQGRAELAARVAAMPSESLPAALTEATRAAQPARRWWMWVPVGAALGLGVWWLSSPAPAPREIAVTPSPPPTVVVVISPSPVVVAPPLTVNPPRPVKRPIARPVPSVAPAMATLDLNAMPWAHVRIDGRDRGDTPLLNLTLPAGSHRIELTNEPLGVHREIVVELHPGEHARRTENMR
jgi:serine/threonine-protein kinase